MKRIGGLALCSALAVVVNHWPLTLFFHAELLLGNCFSVLALLNWGWPGLLVGVLAALSGVPAGGGMQLLITMVGLIWLQLVLIQGDAHQNHRDDGRVVLAAIAYWLVPGGLTILLWDWKVLGLSWLLAAGHAAQLALTGMLSAVIGNAMYVAWLLLQAQRQRGAVSLRGIVFALLTVLMTLPAVVLAKSRASDAHQQALKSIRTKLEEIAQLAAVLPASDLLQLMQQKPSLLLEREQPGLGRWQSDPARIRKLERTYAPSAELPGRNWAWAKSPQPETLRFWVPRDEPVELKRHREAYWQLALIGAGGRRIQVYEPARGWVEDLDGRMQWRSFSKLAVLILLASLISDRLAQALARQIQCLSNGDAQRTLQPSGLRELDALVLHVNQTEQQLAAAQRRDVQRAEHNRQMLERKLRSSLAAAAVVHEIKQPLSTMLLQCRMGLELFQQRGTEAATELQRTLQTLNDQADRVVEIMERMRMLLRNVETDHQSLDLSLTLESALLVLRRELRGAAIDLQTTGLDQPCPVLGDAVQLQIAITNVIRNAIEAMAERRGPRRLLVDLSHSATEAILRIQDSGPGLTNDTTALLLSSSKPQGSGIGLFVVRTTLEHHQGRLVIGRSERLGGAAVELHLPSLSSSEPRGAKTPRIAPRSDASSGESRELD